MSRRQSPARSRPQYATRSQRVVPGSLRDPIQRAWEFFSRGERTQAESLCRSFLTRQPDHAGALTLLGILLAQAQRSEEAAELLGKAAARSPHDASAHNNYGNVLRDLQRPLDALACYDRALALSPDYAEAHFNRGLSLQDLRRHEEAVASYDRALALKPDYAAAWNNRGTVCRALGLLSEALSSYDRTIAARPDHADAHNNRGVVLLDLDRPDEALASLERALSLKPDHAQTCNNHGAALLALERYPAALTSFDRSLALSPLYAEALNNRGIALHHLERYEEALASYDQALAIDPHYPEAHSNRGVSLASLERLDEALGCYEQALQLNSRYPDALRNQGAALHRLKRYDHALASYERALTLRRDADTYRNHGATLQELRRAEEAIASYDRALDLEPDARFLPGLCHHARMQVCDWGRFDADVAKLAAGVESGRPVVSPFVALSAFDSPPLQRKASETWVREEASPRATLPPIAVNPSHDRIRIGYFSADLRDHAVGALTAGLFESHDRSRFHVTAFSLGPRVEDDLRTRLEAAFDDFVPVAGKSDLEVASLARQLQMDIAVDLGGYTKDARPRILALRAAPVQVSYLGFLGTTGAPFIDYLIADPVLVPPESRMQYSEKIAYLPSYQVNDSRRALPQNTPERSELGLPSDGFVFCCFNASYKITPEVFSSWMRILRAVPRSVLFLLGAGTAVERNLRAEAAARGVAPERLVFGRRVAFADYMARYRAADLFLDTLPYNAGTTASDALWAGLPVLTCAGKSLAARIGASLLTAVGLPELIAADRPQYEQLAIALASDPARLRDIRQRLTDSRRTAALFDTRTVTRNLEDLYQQMYWRHAHDLLPDGLQCNIPPT